MAAARLARAVTPREQAVAAAVIKTKVRNKPSDTKPSTHLTQANRLIDRPTQTSPAEPPANGSVSASLQALTSAALVLPGLMVTPAQADQSNTAGFQYSHYQEGKRNLYNVPNNLDPIAVDSIYGNANLSLTDRIKFAFNYIQDTWSGATPVTTAPLPANGNRPIQENSPDGLVTVGASPLINTSVLLDSQLNPLAIDASTGEVTGVDTRVVHILASASPETRKQGDFNLSYEWDELTLGIGGGISLENDYESRFGNLSGRWDLNQKLTTLNLGLSYTNSDVSAILDHDAAPYITKTAYKDRIENIDGSEILYGNRQEWATSFGVTQILSKESLVETTVGYTRSTGYLSNPYKVMTVVFVDPDSATPNSDGRLFGNVKALMEQRPDERNQWDFGANYIHHIDSIDAALHLKYHFSHDDWDINAHTFEADWVQPLGSGWTIAPRIRYYSQSAADFYRPYLVSEQAFSKTAIDDQGREIWIDADNPNNGVEYFRDENFNLVDANGNFVDESTVNVRSKTLPYDHNQLPAHFSSDQRLSGFGALSGGVTISKQFTRGINLELGFEYYTHAGSLKLGGGGEGDYTDFNYYVANATLNVDLAALSRFSGYGGHAGHDHGGHGHHHMASLPAGVMYGHMMPKAGDFMVGYRFMYGRKSGDTLHGTQPATDREIVDNGCSVTIQCRFTPTYMNMGMHMVNIMYAPTDWLNLMLMPKFVDMEMNLRELDGRPPPVPEVHEHTGIAGHATGGVGDTSITALIKLFDSPGHHLHMGLGISAPTGDVDLQFRRTFQEDGGFVHFGMQLGSGTWDFLPSLTYTGMLDQWGWGIQLSGVKRLEDKNETGYRLGDIFQSTAWGSYHLTDWLTASVRGIYTLQGAIKGDYNGPNGHSGPMDFPANYGGHYWDLGMGLSATVLSGDLAGNTLSFEWLQPLMDDVNGYQLERDSALTASWSYAF